MFVMWLWLNSCIAHVSMGGLRNEYAYTVNVPARGSRSLIGVGVERDHGWRTFIVIKLHEVGSLWLVNLMSSGLSSCVQSHIGCSNNLVCIALSAQEEDCH